MSELVLKVLVVILEILVALEVLAVLAADVLQRRKLGSRIFILNRPKALNALDLGMIRTMTPQLQAWKESDLCKVIILKAAGDTAFCAGGDVKRVILDEENGKHEEAVKFFEEEYQLNHLIATINKPFVSIMNGITMGGGVGLSVHGPFRIATEKTLFAMPEAKIGFFPDVGSSFFLPRLDGQIGTYLALTGFQLKATHYVPSNRLEFLEERLSEIECDDNEVINMAIEDYVFESNKDHIYSLAALEGENTDWATKTKNIMLSLSPTSLKVTLDALRKGKKKLITDCFKLEFILAQKFLENSDFKRGVKALLIDKPSTKPEWDPSTLSNFTEFFNDTKIEKIEKIEGVQKLKLLTNISYENYPFSKFNLPSEEEIRKVVTGETPEAGSLSMTKNDVLNFFIKDRRGKIGVREKVIEVLNRKTKGDESNELNWID
ncbi:10762_t:CDS:2 [Diversispora eburnea]|uniref:3-hydroxyisobutyryl-CoA hydrolase n=1 Tax=Diversispora eburnea TaxID=1213867 RepID=A0A9N9A5Y7_9GLOM|nr:10762_t:CDS:2 [Diversispora eburnea]